MLLGFWQLDTVSGGRLRIDGGTMFGVVPKVAWERYQPADDQNRIRCATNCVLARDGRHVVLVDTGYGGHCDERERETYSLEEGEPLLASLTAKGVAPDDVTHVVFSHLHFDHSGGASTTANDGQLVSAFPRARFVVQRAEWEDATGKRPELRGAYPAENLAPLEASGRLDLVDGDAEIVPGLRAIATGGHTRGHQALLFQSEGQTAIYPGDLCPTIAHVRQLWGMAYDTDPLQTRRRKPQLLGQAADNRWWILWDHEPDVAISRLARDERREFIAVDQES